MNTQQLKIIGLSCLGGALEFYDFIIFIFFAKTISALYFPSTNQFASLMATFAVFAIGYLARPIGAIFFGHRGDTKGRKSTFALTVSLMAFPTVLIGLLPTYHQIGITASLLLVALRIMQGISVGGEIPGAAVFTAESVNVGQRGISCGFIFMGITSGALLGSIVSSLVVHSLTPDQVLNWGWRIPFILGGLLGFVSAYLRKNMSESPIFEQQQARAHSQKLPIIEVLKDYPRQILQGVAIIGLCSASSTLFLLYMPTYLTTFFHYPLKTVMTLNTINFAAFALAIPFMGYLSDKKGRKPIFRLGAVGLILLTYPVFSLFASHELIVLYTTTILLGLVCGLLFGTAPSMLIELFPTKIRYSGFAISYNLAFGIFAGLTPLIATGLIHLSGSNLAPAYFLIIFGLITLGITLSMPETFMKEL